MLTTDKIIITACDESGKAYLFQAEGEIAQHIVDLLNAEEQGLLVRLPLIVQTEMIQEGDND